MEFDLATAPTESTMVRYFEEGLKPSIKVEIDQDATHLDNYKELVAKTVRAKAKAGLQPSFYVRETDLQILQESQPIHTIVHKVQIQGAMNYGDDLKASKASASTQESEPFNKAKKDKKRSIIETREILGNPRILRNPRISLPRPLESTRSRSVKIDKRRGTKRI